MFSRNGSRDWSQVVVIVSLVPVLVCSTIETNCICHTGRPHRPHSFVSLQYALLCSTAGRLDIHAAWKKINPYKIFAQLLYDPIAVYSSEFKFF